MKERGLIFGAWKMRYLLSLEPGQEAQTRRVMKQARCPIGGDWADAVHPDGSGRGWVAWWGGLVDAAETKRRYPGDEGFRCPYGVPGDRLYAKEAHMLIPRLSAGEFPVPIESRVIYRADEDSEEQARGFAHPWRSPIYMPRWASRLSLDLVALRVERLQEISEEDAIAEGVPFYVYGHGPVSAEELLAEPGYHAAGSYRAGFEHAWCSLHDKPSRYGESWQTNPFVWALTLRRVEAAEAA